MSVLRSSRLPERGVAGGTPRGAGFCAGRVIARRGIVQFPYGAESRCDGRLRPEGSPLGAALVGGGGLVSIPGDLALHVPGEASAHTPPTARASGAAPRGDARPLANLRAECPARGRVDPEDCVPPVRGLAEPTLHGILYHRARPDALTVGAAHVRDALTSAAPPSSSGTGCRARKTSGAARAPSTRSHAAAGAAPRQGPPGGRASQNVRAGPRIRRAITPT